jgi:hypothetical protein
MYNYFEFMLQRNHSKVKPFLQSYIITGTRSVSNNANNHTNAKSPAILHVHLGQEIRAPLPQDLWKKVTNQLNFTLDNEDSELELGKDFDLDWVDGKGVITCIQENKVGIFIKIIHDFKIKDQKFRAWHHYNDDNHPNAKYPAILNVHLGQETKAPLTEELWKKVTKQLMVSLEIEEDDLELGKDFNLDWVDGRGVIMCINEKTVDTFIEIIQDFKIEDQTFRAWHLSTPTNDEKKNCSVQ